MSRVVRVGTRVIGLLALLLSAARASAQEGGITGVVKDTSGGVLPGTTVTATSPALIEQQRVAVTDAEGRYVITPLRPGLYTVHIHPRRVLTVVREDQPFRDSRQRGRRLRVGSVRKRLR